MWDDSGFGGDSFFDTNHNGRIDAFEADHAECFLHDCDTYDQVLAKEGYGKSSSNRFISNSTHKNNSKNDSTNSNSREPIKIDISLIIILMALVLVVLGTLGINQYLKEWRYAPYDNALNDLRISVLGNNYRKYVNANDWIYSMEPSKVEFDTDRFSAKYNAGEEVVQENYVLYKGIYSYNNFEKKTDRKKASLMCSVLSELIEEAEEDYYYSTFYDEFGSVIESGGTISYKNDVTIIGYETDYGFMLETTDYLFSLNLDAEGKGYFVVKDYNRESYYRYDIIYEDGILKEFDLAYYSLPSGSGTSLDSSSGTNHNSHHSSHNDPYNSSSYSDADSFAEDYYEEFYDYGDYEDDEDAYDEAVDYWNDWNE